MSLRNVTLISKPNPDEIIHWHPLPGRDHPCGDKGGECVSLTPIQVTCQKCAEWMRANMDKVEKQMHDNGYPKMPENYYAPPHITAQKASRPLWQILLVTAVLIAGLVVGVRFAPFLAGLVCESLGWKEEAADHYEQGHDKGYGDWSDINADH